MTLTIVCANAYWGKDTRYRYVLEYRGFFNPHSKPPRLTPHWAIESEQYALGFHPPHYPVPTIQRWLSNGTLSRAAYILDYASHSEQDRDNANKYYAMRDNRAAYDWAEDNRYWKD